MFWWFALLCICPHTVSNFISFYWCGPLLGALSLYPLEPLSCSASYCLYFNSHLCSWTPSNVQKSNMLAFQVLPVHSCESLPSVITHFIFQLPSILFKNTSCVNYWASKSTFIKKYMPHFLLKKSSKQCNRCFCISPESNLISPDIRLSTWY